MEELRLKLESDEREKAKDRDFKFKMAQLKGSNGSDTDGEERSPKCFDVAKYVKLIPTFDESEPDEFFTLFEKLATGLEWPMSLWPVIIQFGLKGKGRSAYLALTPQECKDYELIKSSVLFAYELTAEYYRVKFRRYKKLDNQSYVEYAHNVAKLHDKWYAAANVTDISEYKELIILEQFLRGIPNEVRNYLNEREVTTMQRASHLAENYSLITSQGKKQSKGAPTSNLQTKASSEEVVCFLCKQPGHFKAKCPQKGKLKSDNSSKVSLAIREIAGQVGEKFEVSEPVVEHESSFEPFIFCGKVSASENSKSHVPVRIVRATASSHS